jgi:hypothetical protein
MTLEMFSTQDKVQQDKKKLHGAESFLRR